MLQLTYCIAHCVSDCIVGQRDGEVNIDELLLWDLGVFERGPNNHHLPTTILSLLVFRH